MTDNTFTKKPESKKAKNKFFSKIKYLAFGTVLGALLGVGFTYFLQVYNPPDAEDNNMTTVVFERIEKMNEMVSASQQYCIVDKATDKNTLFNLIDIPFSENSFWYRYEGTLKAGVNFNEATFDQVDSTIIVTLKQPYIISNTPNMEKSGVLEENNNIFNPIHVKDVDDFQSKCIAKSEEDALSGGLFAEAQANAEENLRNIFGAALGDEYTVTFVWE